MAGSILSLRLGQWFISTGIIHRVFVIIWGGWISHVS